MFTILAVNIAVFLYAEASGGSTDLQNMLRLGAAYTPLIRKGQFQQAVHVMAWLLAKEQEAGRQYL